MTPSTRDYFLFDDLLFDEHAKQEHDWLTSLLQDHLGVKLHFFDTLLTESLEAASMPERRALIAQVCRLESGMPPVEQRIGQLEVMVRWFQGHGWPQYPQDPEGDPAADAPGHRPPVPTQVPTNLAALLQHSTDTGPLTAQQIEEFDFLQKRLLSWCDDGDYAALAADLMEGIESKIVNGTKDEGRRTKGSTIRNPQSAIRNGNGALGDDEEALQRFVEGRLFYLTPLPNLMFMRDAGMVVGERLLLGRMAAPGRVREPLLLDFVQRHHSLFKGTKGWTWADARINDPAWPSAASPQIQLEGGNVMLLRDDLIVLGVSGRTSMESVGRIAEVWRDWAAERGKKVVLYVLRLPAGFNHLDSVFGMVSEEECVVYAPVFEPYGPASVDVVRAELGKGPVQPTRSPDFFSSLRRDGLDLTPISCGGSDPVDQQREQWFSAANMLPLAPGKVVVYRSAEATIAELAARDYRIVDINDVQTGSTKLTLGGSGKWALKIKGSELSRGHGGPHSLVLPLVRDT
jgi:arginine deiminase